MDHGPRKRLRRAHHLLEIGDHASAATIFEQLARGAHDRGRLHHAPNLYLQAARANILAGNTEQGKELIILGLGILVDGKRWPQLHRLGNRVVYELGQLGQPDMATEFEKWLTKTLPADHLDKPQQQATARRRQMPLKCPFCGGVLRPDEVEMLDTETGECPYCGSAIRKE